MPLPCPQDEGRCAQNAGAVGEDGHVRPRREDVRHCEHRDERSPADATKPHERARLRREREGHEGVQGRVHLVAMRDCSLQVRNVKCSDGETQRNAERDRDEARARA